MSITAIKTVVKEKLSLKDVETSTRDYARGIRSLVYGLWNGQIEAYTFIDTMGYAVERGITRAWREGAQECGIGEADLTPEEVSARQQLISVQYLPIVDFANAIALGSKANKGKLAPPV